MRREFNAAGKLKMIRCAEELRKEVAYRHHLDPPEHQEKIFRKQVRQQFPTLNSPKKIRELEGKKEFCVQVIRSNNISLTIGK